MNGFLNLCDAASDALQVLFQRRDAGDEAFAVGDQYPYSVSEMPALTRVQRSDRFGPGRNEGFVNFGEDPVQRSWPVSELPA